MDRGTLNEPTMEDTSNMPDKDVPGVATGSPVHDSTLDLHTHGGMEVDKMGASSADNEDHAAMEGSPEFLAELAAAAAGEATQTEEDTPPMPPLQTTTGVTEESSETSPDLHNPLQPQPPSLQDAADDRRPSESDDWQPPKKRRRKPEPMKPFNDMLYELLAFRAREGHCRVPLDTKSALGRWVGSLRTQKSNMRKGYHSPDLSQERLAVLNSIGFVWDLQQFDSDSRWKRQFEDLCRFKQEHGAWRLRVQYAVMTTVALFYRITHKTCFTCRCVSLLTTTTTPTSIPSVTPYTGHCNVPQSTPLGKWVKMQRENYRETQLKAQGQLPTGRSKPRPTLSQFRIEQLESLGFNWKVAAPAVGWEHRFNELLDYRAANGDCNVPQAWPENRQLGRWVMKQRCQVRCSDVYLCDPELFASFDSVSSHMLSIDRISQYTLRQKGEKNQLSDERVRRLEEIGFSWTAPSFRKKKEPVRNDFAGVVGAAPNHSVPQPSPHLMPPAQFPPDYRRWV